MKIPYIKTLMVSVLLISTFVISLTGCSTEGLTETDAETVTAIQSLGEKLYFDENLSNPPGQSCASCHLPTAGFADPDSHFPTSEGIITGRFGNRNSPTASYAAFIPEFHFDAGSNQFIGGQFADGRAASLEEQAQGPFLNALEMNNADRSEVIDKLRASSYAADFEAVFGVGALDDVDTAYVQISEAIAAFERTEIFSPFNSKFDAVQNGTDTFTPAERNGEALFNGKAQCARCHSTPFGEQVFSNFTYRNIGVPANPNNPFLHLDVSLNPDGTDYVDTGLGGVTGDARRLGRFRTPTLRNINETAPYMHNGVFNTLEEVINFYNRRDVDDVTAEVSDNVNDAANIGELGLTDSEVQDLISFLQTLSDR